MLLPFSYLYLSIPVVIAQVFNSTRELAMPTGISTKEAKAEIETHPGTIKVKISGCSI